MNRLSSRAEISKADVAPNHSQTQTPSIYDTQLALSMALGFLAKAHAYLLVLGGVSPYGIQSSISDSKTLNPSQAPTEPSCWL